jgi:hypothetical protein
MLSIIGCRVGAGVQMVHWRGSSSAYSSICAWMTELTQRRQQCCVMTMSFDVCKC